MAMRSRDRNDDGGSQNSGSGKQNMVLLQGRLHPNRNDVGIGIRYNNRQPVAVKLRPHDSSSRLSLKELLQDGGFGQIYEDDIEPGEVALGLEDVQGTGETVEVNGDDIPLVSARWANGIKYNNGELDQVNEGLGLVEFNSEENYGAMYLMRSEEAFTSNQDLESALKEFHQNHLSVEEGNDLPLALIGVSDKNPEQFYLFDMGLENVSDQKYAPRSIEDCAEEIQEDLNEFFGDDETVVMAPGIRYSMSADQGQGQSESWYDEITHTGRDDDSQPVKEQLQHFFVRSAAGDRKPQNTRYLNKAFFRDFTNVGPEQFISRVQQDTDHSLNLGGSNGQTGSSSEESGPEEDDSSSEESTEESEAESESAESGNEQSGAPSQPDF